MMAFGFLSTLDGWLRLATKSSEMDWIDGMSGEKINAKISGSLAMTEAQAKREFRSLVAKKAWADRKARESAAA
jgi:Fe-S cluster assembly scaffold protein SufB